MKHARMLIGGFAVVAGLTSALLVAAPAAAQDSPHAAPSGGGPGVMHGQPGQPSFKRPHRFPRMVPSGMRVPGHGPGAAGPGAHEPTGAPPHGEGAGHGEAAGHGEHEGGHHELAAINWADFSNKKQVPYAALLINLAVLGFIAVRFGKKPVSEGLKKRKTDIAKDIEEAARLKKDAQERAKKYQASLGNLDKDLETTKKGLEDAGRAEKERLIAEANERAARMKRDADFLLDQERKQTQVDLSKQAVLEASALAEQLLKNNLTPQDHERFCEEFLQDLGKKAAGATASQAGAAS